MLKLEKLCDSLSYTQIAVSQYDKKLLSSVKIHGGIHGTIVIHNACPALKITQEQLIYQKLFEQLKKSGKKIILSISRFNTTQNSQGIYCQSKQQKNFPLTLEVAKSLGEDYQFIWIGNTGIAPQSLPKNIMLLGSLANAKAYLPLADLFLLLSHYEGLPISILESLSVGIPVLASAVGGVEELIKEGETGFLDYSHKADLISQKIKKLFASPQKLKQAMYAKAKKAYGKVIDTLVKLTKRSKKLAGVLPENVTIKIKVITIKACTHKAQANIFFLLVLTIASGHKPLGLPPMSCFKEE
ncbi:UNVERIFIED_CONTAM: hypothetical protein PYX00_010978 [Menopon gallinae]|uniref:Glycosyl transferase family 1 domain-containing protein n=1 Tax=Menopon gallinae TaxID=328185 RepID=A0AAW2H6T6_9NEOP